MRSTGSFSTLLTVLLPVIIATITARPPQQKAATDLGGTSWQLVKFQGSDDRTLTPDDKAKYTVSFAADGGVSVRIDCNRGHGVWKSSGANQIEFGPMALTQAMCPGAPLNDRIPKDWSYVRSYLLKDGHLFLSLMADGGVYEFEPMELEGHSAAAVTGTAIYRERMALPPSAVFEATLEDISRADAPAHVVSRIQRGHPGNPPIKFDIPYDPVEIDPSHSYSVRAKITSENQLLFNTTQNYPVLTRGNQNAVTLMLLRSSSPTPAGNPESSLSDLPATFIGTLPCADCPGIRYQVNLLADHTFVSRMAYENRNSSFRENGIWQLTSDGKMLVLQKDNESREQFGLPDQRTLRKLDANGKEIESKLNYDLRRAPQFMPME